MEWRGQLTLSQVQVCFAENGTTIIKADYCNWKSVMKTRSKRFLIRGKYEFREFYKYKLGLA